MSLLLLTKCETQNNSYDFPFVPLRTFAEIHENLCCALRFVFKERRIQCQLSRLYLYFQEYIHVYTHTNLTINDHEFEREQGQVFRKEEENDVIKL